MASEVQKTIEINNTPIGWTKLTKEIKTYTQLTVHTSIKNQLDDQQLFCLRYCFVELDRLDQYHLVRYPFTLQIRVEKESDAFRIQHYLAVMTALRNINLEIFCGKQIIRGRRNLSYDFYRILPPALHRDREPEVDDSLLRYGRSRGHHRNSGFGCKRFSAEASGVP